MTPAAAEPAATASDSDDDGGGGGGESAWPRERTRSCRRRRRRRRRHLQPPPPPVTEPEVAEEEEPPEEEPLAASATSDDFLCVGVGAAGCALVHRARARAAAAAAAARAAAGAAPCSGAGAAAAAGSSSSSSWLPSAGDVVVAAWTAVSHSVVGVYAAHHPQRTSAHVVGDAHCRRCFGQCLFLCAGLYRGALYLYEAALPALCHAMLGVELRGDWRYAAARANSRAQFGAQFRPPPTPIPGTTPRRSALLLGAAGVHRLRGRLGVLADTDGDADARRRRGRRRRRRRRRD